MFAKERYVDVQDFVRVLERDRLQECIADTSTNVSLLPKVLVFKLHGPSTETVDRGGSSILAFRTFYRRIN